VAAKLRRRWSTEQIVRWLRRRYSRRRVWQVCVETVYGALPRADPLSQRGESAH
jgi:IS30 family transposase